MIIESKLLIMGYHIFHVEVEKYLPFCMPFQIISTTSVVIVGKLPLIHQQIRDCLCCLIFRERWQLLSLILQPRKDTQL